jgi:cytochrome c-type biogenesis protein CcmH
VRVLLQLERLKLARSLAAAIFILGSISVAHADVTDPTQDRPFADPAREAEARSFMRQIRCVVCQSQSIDESDAEIAVQLRNSIREQMAAGKSPGEIRDYLVARYGDFVLLDPPFKPATLILWIGPFALAAIGLGVLFLQRRRKPAATTGGSGLAPPDLSENERARVQRLLVESEDEPPQSPSRGGAI